MPAPHDKERLLQEYVALSGERDGLRTKLEAVEARLTELRNVLIDNPDTPVVVEEGAGPKKREKRGLSVFERLRREPPPALAPVVEFIRQRGRARNQDVAEALGISVEQASVRLSRATKDGWLRRVAQGMYELDPLCGTFVKSKGG